MSLLKQFITGESHVVLMLIQVVMTTE